MQSSYNTSTLASSRCQKVDRGFTLIELLVVISIIAMLISILLPALGMARISAKQITEMAAGRQLAQVLTMYQDDYKGYFISGDFQPDSNTAVQGYDGTVLTDSHANFFQRTARGRYAYRIGTYAGGIYKGMTHVGDTLQYVASDSPTDFELYIASLAPSFGLNSEYLSSMEFPHSGMQLEQIDPTWRDEVAYRTAVEVPSPSSMIAFSSARTYIPGDDEYLGYYYVRAPYGFGNTDWSAAEFSRFGADNADWGRVDPRFHDASVVGFIDGHAQAMKLDAMRDMRLWSKEAQLANNANYNP